MCSGYFAKQDKLIIAPNFLNALYGVRVAVVDNAVRWIDCPCVRAAANLKP